MTQRMHTGLLLAAAAVLTGMAACGNGDSSTTQAAQAFGAIGESSNVESALAPAQPATGRGSQEGSAGFQATECSPAQVAGILEALNKEAIHGAKLAEKNAKSEDVRAYAKEALAYHKNLKKQLNEWLDAAGIEPAKTDIATRLKATGKEDLESLRESKHFDRDYAAHAVIHHAKSVGLLESLAIPGAKPADAGAASAPGTPSGQPSEKGAEAKPTTPSEAPKAGSADALVSLVKKTCADMRQHEKKAYELESKVRGACGGATAGDGGAGEEEEDEAAEEAEEHAGTERTPH